MINELNKTEIKQWNLIKVHLRLGNTEPAKSWLREAPNKKSLSRRSQIVSDFSKELVRTYSVCSV